MRRTPASDPARLPRPMKGFSPSPSTPPRPPHDHHIELLDGTTLPNCPRYSLSKVEQLALQEFLNENLNNRSIRPSQSSPVLFIKKKDGALCLAVHECGLNKITKKDGYPLPLIPVLLDRLRSARVFSKARSSRHLQSRAHSRRR